MSRRSRGLSATDLLAEAAAGIARRTGRSVLTALGTVLGVGALVATLGLTTTAGAQIGRRFDLLKATEVVVQDTRPNAGSASVFPPDVQGRLERLNGVRHAGLSWTVRDDASVSSLPPGVADRSESSMTLLALSPGALRAMQPVVSRGRVYDPVHDRRAERVAVLGAAAAARLGVSLSDDGPTAVFIDDRPFTVMGIVRDVARRPELLLSVAVPERTARQIWGHRGEENGSVLIQTDLGAAQLIGRQAPLAILPQDPRRLLALVPPDPRSLRTGVESDVNALVLVVALVMLVIGSISIANTTLVSVLERVSEIGLRRAIGATRRDVAAQFLAESSILGMGGGLLGTCLGVIAVVSVSGVREWTPVIGLHVIVLAPLVGMLTGLLAGLYPSLKAARIEPVDALRR